LLKAKKSYIFFIIILFLSSFSSLKSKEIPIIVISPSKKAQSISTVGTSVTVLDEEFIKNADEYFLGDLLSSSSTSINFFQNGGHGTSSGIQLRGLPKRYSTVYIDGVKMSDPSSPTGDFDFNNILTSQISRVEILKGNQSSIYGSGAIGGTINITTKKGKPGFQNDFSYIVGSNKTHNISTSLSGADKKKSFYIGFERFQSAGISQMTHNDEKDRYRNNSLSASYGYFFSDQFEVNNRLRISENYLQYDAVSSISNYDHSEESDGVEASYNLSLIHKPLKNFTNNLTLANTYIKRIYADAPNSKNTIKDSYYGQRYSLMYSGNYNFNLDNSLVLGFEKEFDEMGYNENASGTKYENSKVNSKYFDFQKRISNNLYGTIGSRFDKHSIAGTEEAHRVTLAYLFNDKSTKIKTSYGTGFRYPSLYEMYFIWGAGSNILPYVKAENSKSFDIGITKSFEKFNFEIDYFNTKYSDTLEAWASSSYATQNQPGIVKSQGIEFLSNWNLNSFLNLDLNYTYTSTYDGAEQDDPNNSLSYYNSQIVRIPRNLINLKTNFKIADLENFNFTINTKWSDTARDYGNGNNGSYLDVTLDDYLVIDLHAKYNFFNKYNFFINIANLFDEDYETAKDYSQMPRTLNFGIKKIFSNTN
jgi:vitamin B12 transporter